MKIELFLLQQYKTTKLIDREMDKQTVKQAKIIKDEKKKRERLPLIKNQ